MERDPDARYRCRYCVRYSGDDAAYCFKTWQTAYAFAKAELAIMAGWNFPQTTATVADVNESPPRVLAVFQTSPDGPLRIR